MCISGPVHLPNLPIGIVKRDLTVSLDVFVTNNQLSPKEWMNKTPHSGVKVGLKVGPSKMLLLLILLQPPLCRRFGGPPLIKVGCGEIHRRTVTESLVHAMHSECPPLFRGFVEAKIVLSSCPAWDDHQPHVKAAPEPAAYEAVVQQNSMRAHTLHAWGSAVFRQVANFGTCTVGQILWKGKKFWV